MKSVREIVEMVQRDMFEGSRTSGWWVPTKVPKPLRCAGCPDDLIEFYTCCGGMHYLPREAFRYTFVRPDQFLRADLSDHLWLSLCRESLNANGVAKDQFIIATLDEVEATILVDLSPRFLGRCYQVYPDTFGTPQAPVVARSFTELLNLLVFKALEFDEEPKWYGFFGDADLLPERVDAQILLEARSATFPKETEYAAFWESLKRLQDRA